MEKHEIREALKNGGAWIGAARNWLLWHKDTAGGLTWGSNDEVRMTVKEIEELALEVATAAVHESQDLVEALKRLLVYPELALQNGWNGNAFDDLRLAKEAIAKATGKRFDITLESVEVTCKACGHRFRREISVVGDPYCSIGCLERTK